MRAKGWLLGWVFDNVGQLLEIWLGIFSSLAPGDFNLSRLVFSVEIVSALSLRIRERSLYLFRCKMCLQLPCPDLSHYHSQLPVKLVAVIQKSGHAMSE